MAAKRKVLVRGFALWQKDGSTKVWIEAGRRKAALIISGKSPKWYQFITSLLPYGWVFNLMVAINTSNLKPLRRRLKKNRGKRGLWIGLDAAMLVPGNWPKNPTWWKNVDARPRTKANMKKEPNPW